MVNRNKLTVVCTTCEDFKDMWQNQINGLTKYWVSHPPVLFVSDKKQIDNNMSNFYFSPGNYSDRLLNALNLIKTEYVFLTLDDYLLYRKIDSGFIEFLIDYLDDNNGSYMKIYKSRTGKVVDKKNRIRSLPLKEVYEVSMTPSIWKTKDLISIIKTNMTPWELEVSMTSQSRKVSINCFSCYKKNVYPYVDVVRKGKYLRKAYTYLRKNNLYISDRSIMPLHESIRRGVRSFIAKIMPRKLKTFISRTLKLKTFSSKEKSL